MRRHGLFVAAALATVMVASVSPALGVPGSLGAAQVLAVSIAPSPYRIGLATLASGATAVGWADAGGGSLNVRVRPPGSNTWGGVVTYAPPAPFNLDAENDRPVVRIAALGGSKFLALWVEADGATRRLRAAVLQAGSPAWNPVTIDATTDGMGESSVTTNAAGRAVAVWSLSAGAGGVRFAVLPSAQGSWSSAADVGSAMYSPQVAVASNGSFCVLYARAIAPAPTTQVQARCHAGLAPTGGATWVTQLRAQQFVAVVALPLPGYASISAVGNSFVTAVSVKGTGTGAIAGTAIDAMRIVVREKAVATAGSWALVGEFARTDEVLTRPTIHGFSDGRLLLTYLRIEGSVESSVADNSTTVATLGVDRSSSGVWSRPVLMSAVTVPLSSVIQIFATAAPAVGPGGAVVIPNVQTDVSAPAPSITFTTTYRPAWGAAMLPATAWSLPALLSSSSFSSAGRLTVVAQAFTGGVSRAVARTSAMPRPLVLRAATLSAAPKRGVAVSCQSSWSEANSVAYRWLRNGAIISGATSSTYTPRAVDVGRSLACRAIGKNPAGLVASNSAVRTVSS